MMQSAHSRHSYYLTLLVTAPFHHAVVWSCLTQSDVSAVVMIIRQILKPKTPEMKLVQRNHMIKQLPADATDKPFCCPVLPRATNAGLHWLEIARF